MMPEDNDMLCPWCLGELPGKPGQVAKCRHCGSDIHWGDGKPYKTKFQAAQPNPVVRDVPVKLKRTPRVPIEIENESGQYFAHKSALKNPKAHRKHTSLCFSQKAALRVEKIIPQREAAPLIL